ncbi:MAG TPA: aspartate aminotransferase family protein [Actinomycetota bacterium]|nr:aspartate aminotransferase family protein [Actinomycetota bacterium]
MSRPAGSVTTPGTLDVGAGPFLDTYRRLPVTFRSGSGSHLTDDTGREYLDFLAGISVCALGHSHPALVEAIREQASRLIHVSNLFHTDVGRRAAQDVCDLLGGGGVFFCNSGAEAVEAAIKLARKRAWRLGQRDRMRIVALDGSFHGRTYGALAATFQASKREGFGPLPGGFDSVEPGDVAALDAAVTPQTAAVIIEPVQGEGGVRPLSPDFARAASSLCRDRGALLVCDEIQTGLGRTGRWWGFEHLRVRPDVVCMAKGLGGGFPVGAIWASDDVRDGFAPGDHATTFGGGPLACAAVSAVIGAIRQEGLVERAESVGALLADHLSQSGEVRGKGLLLALELGRPIAAAVVASALEEGLVVNYVTPSAVRIAPPLVITDDEAAEGARRLNAAIRKVAGA